MKKKCFKRAAMLCAAVILLSFCSCKNSRTADSQQTESSSAGSLEPTPEEAPSRIHFLGKRDDAVTTQQGVYFLGPDAPNVIYYYDEQNDTSVPLCSRPECAHNDDSCSAYMEGMLYLLLDDQNQTQPLYLYRTVESTQEGQNPKVQLYSMDANGANRTLRMEYQNGLVDLPMAASEDFLYFIASEVNPSTQSSIECLYQVTLRSGKLEKLQEYSQPTTLLGAYDQKLILEHNNDSLRQVAADIFEYDVVSKQEKQLFHYEAAPWVEGEFNGKPHPVAFSWQNELYIFEPSEERKATLTCWDLRTGEKNVLAQGVPYYGDQIAEDVEFADGKLILLCAENRADGSGVTSQTFAIDLKSGAWQEIDLKDQYGLGYEVVGATADHYVFALGESLHTSEVVKKDGTKETLRYYAPDFYLMEKADYYSSTDHDVMYRGWITPKNITS